MTDLSMTPAELEVWRTVQEMNRAWTSGQAERLDTFFHPQMVAVTPTDREPLVGRAACVAAWQNFVNAASIRAWRENNPRVRVFGEAAVVSYGYELDCELGSRQVTLTGRDLFFLVREGGRWLAVGDQFSPYPGTPAPMPTGWEASRKTAPAEPPRLVLTILAVTDLDRATRFYQQAFGWPARIEVPVYVELALPNGRGLGLYRREGFARNTGQAPAAVAEGAVTGTELYLHCDDLDAAVARLERAGARLLSARSPRDWGDEAAYFADPDGNVLVVARPMAAPAGTPKARP